MSHYICTLKARPVNPYIANVEAGSKTAAAQIFLDDIKDHRNARTSVACVRSIEITEKKAAVNGIRVLK